MTSRRQSSPARRRIRLSPRALFDLARRARGNESGSTAIEFALVAMPFLALILAIIELGLMFFAGRILDNAVSDSARLIRTGQAFQGGFTAAAFRDEVMSRLPSFFSAGKLVIDVRTFDTFASVSAGLPEPLDEDKNLTVNSIYDAGGASDIVVVRVFYPWPMLGSYLGVNFADMADGSRLLGAIQAFRNEPFPETSSLATGSGTAS